MPEQNMAHDSRNMEPEDLPEASILPTTEKRKKCYVYLPKDVQEKIAEYQEIKGLSFSESCLILLDAAVNAALRQHFVLDKAMELHKGSKKGSISA